MTTASYYVPSPDDRNSSSMPSQAVGRSNALIQDLIPCRSPRVAHDTILQGALKGYANSGLFTRHEGQ